MAVQFDVGELGVLQGSCVRSREATSCVYYKIGNSGAMVGVWSSLISKSQCGPIVSRNDARFVEYRTGVRIITIGELRNVANRVC